MIAEGHSWIKPADGSRFPASFRETRLCKERRHVWKEPQVVEMEFKDRQPFNDKMWMEEEGRYLVGNVEIMVVRWKPHRIRSVSNENLNHDVECLMVS